MDEACGITKYVRSAIRLCEMCIDRRDDLVAMIILAVLLMVKIPGVEKEVDRVMSLWKSYLERSGDCGALIKFVRRMAFGDCAICHDMLVAVRLCEMCTDMRNKLPAMGILGELLITGSSGVGKDISRGMELFDKYLLANGSSEQ